MKSIATVSLVLMILMLQLGCGGGSTPAPTPAVLQFTSTPPTAAHQGQAYTYNVVATGGSSAITYRLVSGPADASLSGSTLTWTPSVAQARSASTFTISAQSGTSSIQQTWSLTPTGTVQGQRAVTFVSGSTDVLQPDDTSTLPLNIAAPDGRGGFTAISGTGSSNGTFQFPDVPGGHYWLQIDATTFVWTDRSTVDTGYDAVGRPSASFPTVTTSVDLEITGLNPWQSTDRLQMYVPTSNSWINLDQTSWNIVAGAVSLSQQIVWTNPIIEGSEGDSPYLTQLVTVPVAGGRSIQALRRSLEEPIEGLSQSEGSEMVLEAELVEASAGGVLHPVVLGSAFAQLEPTMSPTGASDSSYLYLDVDPAPTTRGWIGATPDLVSFDGTDSPITTDIDLGEISFGNPYPSTWNSFFDYIHYIHRDYTAQGASTPVREYAAVEIQTTTVPTAGSPISPVIGTIVAPKINQGDFFADQTGVGLTPTLSWTAPTVGTPTAYLIEIIRVYNNEGDSLREPTAELYTSTTSAQLPPGILASGNSYYFRVSAIAEPGITLESAPLRHSFPRAVAQALSGIVWP